MFCKIKIFNFNTYLTKYNPIPICEMPISSNKIGRLIIGRSVINSTKYFLHPVFPKLRLTSPTWTIIFFRFSWMSSWNRNQHHCISSAVQMYFLIKKKCSTQRLKKIDMLPFLQWIVVSTWKIIKTLVEDDNTHYLRFHLFSSWEQNKCHVYAKYIFNQSVTAAVDPFTQIWQRPPGDCQVSFGR